MIINCQTNKRNQGLKNTVFKTLHRLLSKGVIKYSVGYIWFQSNRPIEKGIGYRNNSQLRKILLITPVKIILRTTP